MSYVPKNNALKQHTTYDKPTSGESTSTISLKTTTKNKSTNILIVTVTKVEALAVFKEFCQSTGKEQRQVINGKTYYCLGTHGDVPIYMVQSEMGTGTPGGALVTIMKAIQDIHPQAIIMCGIAFGAYPEKQKLGEILIAKQIQTYELQKKDLERGTIPRGDRATSSDRLLDRFRSADLYWTGAKTHFGLILSGEKLINDPAFKQILLDDEPDAIGGEMEGTGLYIAARSEKIDWILVKAICDWADGTKQDNFQELAARNAAQFVLHVLQQGGWVEIELDKKNEDIDSIIKENFSTELVDNEIKNHLDTLKKVRFFAEFDRVNYAMNFAERVSNGDFSIGNSELRSKALAWCARILIVSEKDDKAEEYLNIANILGQNIECKLAHAFIISKNGDISTALDTLAELDLPEARSAAFMIIANHKGPHEALDWLQRAGIAFDEIDADGKYKLFSCQLQIENWGGVSETLKVITDDDRKNTPILNHLVAIGHLLKVVPEEFRITISVRLPFMLADYPFASDINGLSIRREAIKYFIIGSQVATELNCPITAIIDDEYALWLQLSDPDERQKGQTRLEELLRDPKNLLRKTNFAVQFGVKFDLDNVGKKIDREISLHGKITENAAIARYALLFSQKSYIDFAKYLIKYKSELEQFVDNKSLRFLEIEMFSKAGMSENAKTSRDMLLEEGLSETEQIYLQAIIAKDEGVVPIETFIMNFNKTNSLYDLGRLVDELRIREDWESICHYGQILFNRTRNLKDIERFVNALYNTHRFDSLVKLLKDNSEYLSQSTQLHIYYCWALFFIGAFLEAREELTKINIDLNSWDFLMIQIKINIALGDWKSLSKIIDNEWVNRERRNPQELILIAQLALSIKSPRAKELIYFAADKGINDSNVLVSAYVLAVQGNWEKDPIVNFWLEQAAAMSGDDGPVQKVSIKDLFDSKPNWDQQESKTWEAFTNAEIPISIAATFFNRSILELTLGSAILNQTEIDPRRRVLIPSFSGNRQPMYIDTKMTIGIDISSMITLNLIGLLKKTFDSFDIVYIPHTTLTWLFNENQRISFHQPSRISNAEQAQNFIATGVLKELIPSTVADSELSALIGDELALLIAEAEMPRYDNDKKQRIVVRSSPIHQLGSFSMEEADLVSHANVLSSCMAVVNKLRENGLLTDNEAKIAGAFLSVHEKPWPQQPKIADGAILYLDTLTITYFNNLNLLESLRLAGFEIFASPRYISEINRFISYKDISTKINIAIEQIREIISSQIEGGKIQIGKKSDLDRSEEPSIYETPTVDLFNLTENCKAIIVDDRYFNQHPFIENNNKKASLFTTIDILKTFLDNGVITENEYEDKMTTLRRAGFLFIPINKNELFHHFNKPKQTVNRFIETAELKAIRENFLCARMSTWLQHPKEENWLNTTSQTFTQSIIDIWQSNKDLTEIKSYSNWMFDQLDIRGWAHRIDITYRNNFIKFGRISNMTTLLFPFQGISSDVQEEYWIWIEERLIKPIYEQFPDLYSWIINLYKKQIFEIANKYFDEGNSEK